MALTYEWTSATRPVLCLHKHIASRQDKDTTGQKAPINLRAIGPNSFHPAVN